MKAFKGLKSMVSSRSKDGEVTENLNLQIKSTPVKGAPQCSRLAILSSNLLKRNEQGSWQRRYACLVPHLFLYYFESESSTSPRGVIDLEYFTKCSVNNDGILVVSPTEGTPLRSFYFKIDDVDSRNEWINSIQRDRFHNVREERDQYFGMQENYLTQMNEVTQSTSIMSEEKESLQMERDYARQQVDDTFRMIQRLLAVVAIGDDDLIDPSLCDSIGPASEALERKINELRTRLETERHNAIKLARESGDRTQQEILGLQEKINAEEKVKRDMELQMKQDKENYDRKIYELTRERDILHKQVEEMKFSTKISEEKAVSEIVTLNDQKKLLVKEVKQCRKKLEGLTESFEKEKEDKEKLVKKCNDLENLLGMRKPQQQPVSSNIAVDSSSHSISSMREGFEDMNVNDSIQLKDSTHTTDNGIIPSTSQQQTNMAEYTSNGILGNKNLVDAENSFYEEESESSIITDTSLNLEINGNVKSAIGGANLSSYDWLTEEQRSKIAMREASEQNSQQQTPQKRNSLTNSLLSFVPGKNKDKAVASSSSCSSQDGIAIEENIDASPSRASFSSPLPDNDSGVTMRTSISSSSLDVNNSDKSNSIASKGYVPICYRCNGTVEGPKYSTCKCKVPAMCPEDVKKKKRSLVGSLFFGGSESNTPGTTVRPGDSSVDTTPCNSQHSLSDVYNSFESRTDKNETES